MIKFIIAVIACTLVLGSCTVVKGYEKVNLNDPDMELSGRALERSTVTFHSYREASAGANGGKTGGGCGCN